MDDAEQNKRKYSALISKREVDKLRGSHIRIDFPLPPEEQYLDSFIKIKDPKDEVLYSGKHYTSVNKANPFRMKIRKVGKYTIEVSTFLKEGGKRKEHAVASDTMAFDEVRNGVLDEKGVKIDRKGGKAR